MSSWGQLTAASGGILMPEVTSWMCEAHWVKLAPSRSTVVNRAKEGIPGAGGARPSENTPVGHCSHDHSRQRPRMGPRRVSHIA